MGISYNLGYHCLKSTDALREVKYIGTQIIKLCG